MTKRYYFELCLCQLFSLCVAFALFLVQNHFVLILRFSKVREKHNICVCL